MARPRSVTIVEVGPRDGLQNDPVILDVATRVAMIRRLAEAGLTRIEVASFVNPKRVPQMADAEAVIVACRDLPGVSLSGLVLNARGYDRAEGVGGLHEVCFALPVSETFCRKNQGASLDELVEGYAAFAGRAERAGLLRCVAIATAFGCPFEGEMPVEAVIALADRIARIGAEEISLADTIGVATPAEVETRFARLAEQVPGIRLRAHFHNTRNTGYANADAALRAGVSVLDASLAGTGGCPFAPGATGNIATEDLTYMLERSGIATGLSLPRLREGALWLEGVLGRRLAAQLAHVPDFPNAA